MTPHLSNALAMVEGARRELDAATAALRVANVLTEARLGRAPWPPPEDVAARRLGIVAEHLAKAVEMLENMA